MIFRQPQPALWAPASTGSGFDEPGKHGGQIEAVIEAILILTEIPVRILVKIKGVIGARDCSFQVPQDRVDPGWCSLHSYGQWRTSRRDDGSGIPCLTLRGNTERPITFDEGSNVLVGTDPCKILREAELVLDGKGKIGSRPELWDGNAAERIIDILTRQLA